MKTPVCSMFLAGMLAAILNILVLAPHLSAAPSFTLDSPVGGESWMTGTSHDITWSSSGVSGTVCVEILKLKENGSTVCFGKADAIPVENSKWTWNIPYEIPETTFFVRISLTGSQEMEAVGGDFSITKNPSPHISIRAPVGGETWAVGTAHFISWESHSLEGNIEVVVLKSGEELAEISGIPALDGRYAWTVPPGYAEDDDYQISVRSSDAGIESTSGEFRISASPPQKKKWTFMKYIDADNDLEKSELDAFSTIASVGSDDNVNVVAQIDRHPAYDTRFGDWTDAKRFYVERGMEPSPANAVQDLGEINMASESSLADFLCWAMDNYPADRYFLVFSNHGLGWEIDEGEYDGWKTGGLRQGGGRDDTNGKLYLSNRAIQKGIDAAPSDLSIVGFDACDMDMIEVVYQLRNTGAKVFIGSQNTEDWWGWDYVPVLSILQCRPDSISEPELGSLVCNTFMDNNERYTPFYYSTQAAIDLATVESLSKNLSGLADAMRLNNKDRKVVRQAASSVIAAIRQSVICERHSRLMDGKIYGMNFYFPDKSIDPKYNAENLDFVPETGWKNFLDAYFAQNLGKTWIGKARKGLWEEYEWEDPESDYGHIDIAGFCLRLKPETYGRRIYVSASPGTVAETIPSGYVNVEEGEEIVIEAKLKDLPEASLYHFARWTTSGGAVLENPFSQQTALTVDHDTSATAIFAENKDSYLVTFSVSGPGAITGESSQTVASGGSCTQVGVVPQEGYSFLYWTGDFSGTQNPLTVTNVLSDMRITAVFGDPVSMGMRSLSIKLDKGRTSDTLSIKNADYPATAPESVESAKLAVDGVEFDCPAGEGWSSKNGVFTYATEKGVKPKFKLAIDPSKRKWSFGASRFSGVSDINPLDGVSMELTVNGKSAGCTLVPFDNLSLKSKIGYSDSEKP